MVNEALTAQQAFASVQEKAPWVHPNLGFWHQLKLFEAMGYKVDLGYEPYKAMMQMQHRQLATINTRPMPKLCKVN